MGSMLSVPQNGLSANDFSQNQANPNAPRAHSKASHSKGNYQSTAFTFETSQLNPDKVQSFSSDTSTSVLGARSQAPTANPANPRGA
jgi:hypothetical protein